VARGCVAIGFLSILSFAHCLVRERLWPGDIAIDATMGNGHDTLFLASLVGEGGLVYAFDVQEAAVASTRARLNAAGVETVRCVALLRDHAEMAAALPEELHGRVGAVMFNLGYLPGGDHKVVTAMESTLRALDAGLSLLRVGGVLTVVVYPGHEGGGEEAAAVDSWAAALPQEQCQALSYRFLNQRNAPPYVVAIEKRK
jgi:predicted methyltransferase